MVLQNSAERGQDGGGGIAGRNFRRARGHHRCQFQTSRCSNQRRVKRIARRSAQSGAWQSSCATLTTGNASGINDGAAAMIIASEAAAKAHGLTPRARILGMASAGVEPRIMGIGPVPATRKLLTRIGLHIADFDAIELNEAFASQSLAVMRALGLSDDAAHVNPNGGAIALGHPLGMSGARLAMTLVHQLESTGGRRGLATLCVGVGMGLALAVERV